MRAASAANCAGHAGSGSTISIGLGGGSALTHSMPSGSPSVWRVISSAVGIAGERRPEGGAERWAIAPARMGGRSR